MENKTLTMPCECKVCNSIGDSPMYYEYRKAGKKNYRCCKSKYCGECGGILFKGKNNNE